VGPFLSTLDSDARVPRFGDPRVPKLEPSETTHSEINHLLRIRQKVPERGGAMHGKLELRTYG
jgi:hypothetical protein